MSEGGVSDRIDAAVGEPSEIGLLQAVCENASGSLFVLDERQHCIYMNTAAVELTGYKLNELQGRPLHEFIHHSHPDGSHYPIEDCPIDRAFPESRRQRGQDVFIHKDGHFFEVAYTASPLERGNIVVGTVVEVRDISAELAAYRALEEETHTLETLNRTGSMLAGRLDLEEIVQAVTDAATELSGARYGAFFYNTVEEGEAMRLYTLSGAPREAFSAFPQPRYTAMFEPTFVGGTVIRSDDVRQDPRHARNMPFNGLPPGHLPVTSYLSVPVVSRTGEIHGALIFGHERPGIFTQRSERIVTGIAAQAAIAMDNSNLFKAAQRQIAERERSEAHQRLLAQELNHRVKNMLATVRSIATQTFRGPVGDAARDVFEGRLLALSKSHSLIMEKSWKDVSLESVVSTGLQPFVGDITSGNRVLLEGEAVQLTPKLALALGMGVHELATNAVKYGALKVETGRIEVRWRNIGDDILCITWVEKDGPPVAPPDKTGFGTTLLERGLAHELDGSVRIVHDPAGLICEIRLPFPGAGE